MSFIYAQTSGITQTFNDSGNPESLTAPYNLELNSATLSAFRPDVADLVNYLNKSGYRYDSNQKNNGYYGIVSADDPNGVPLGVAIDRGFLGDSAEAHREQYNLSYQYGITDRLSVGALIPYIHTQVSVNAGISGNNTADDIWHYYQSTGRADQLGKLGSTLDALRSMNINTLQGLLASAGYAPFADSNQSGLGDVVLGGRYNYLNQRSKAGDWISSAQAGVTVPTGKLRPPSELTQTDFGNGCWDLGIANIVNYTPFRLLTLSTGLHYTHRFKASRSLFVRKDPSETIPTSADEENVSMLLGDKYWANVGADFHFTEAVTLSASYEWDRKFQDRYRGADPNRDYSYLSSDTDAYMEVVQLGASLSSIPSFMKHEFPLPADVSLNVYLPTTGKNTIIAPYGTGELALYF